MTKGWGIAASVVLVVAATAITGCGGSADAEDKATETKAAEAPTVAEARRAYEGDLNDLAWKGCPADCTQELNEVVANARTLRKAMNADKAGPQFWSPAYRLIDQIESGEAGGNMNRPLVLRPAHELKDWLRQHPSQ